MTKQIAIAYGNGIGYDIMDAALQVMREAGALLDIEILQMGEEEYRLGAPNGFDNRTLRAVQRIGVLLKAPTTDPSQIPELEGDFTPVSPALYAALELSKQEYLYIHKNDPEFTAISSINDEYAVFETALEPESPSNPSSMILAATHMLNHIGQNEVAQRIGAALLKVLEAGITDNIGDAVVTELNR